MGTRQLSLIFFHWSSVINQFSFGIGDFGLLVIGDCLFVIGYLESRQMVRNEVGWGIGESVNGDDVAFIDHFSSIIVHLSFFIDHFFVGDWSVTPDVLPSFGRIL